MTVIFSVEKCKIDRFEKPLNSLDPTRGLKNPDSLLDTRFARRFVSIGASPQLPRPEGTHLNLLLGVLDHLFHAPFLPTFPLLSPRVLRLSGFSTPLTTLSRKFVNVHACPIIRSLSTFVCPFFFFCSRFLDRSLPPVPCFSSTVESRDRPIHESRIRFGFCSRASRKRSIAARCVSPPWSKRKEWKRRSGIVSPRSIKGEFTWLALDKSLK